MDTSLIERKLTDGSMTWDVVFVDGSARAVIACATLSHALSLMSAFQQHAVDATIN